MEHEQRAVLKEKFSGKIRVDPNGCWIWTGNCNSAGGYGLLFALGKTWRAHRLSYELFKGPIPSGLQIDHLCRTPPCVNPEHLEAVTSAENTYRGYGPTAINKRKLTCEKGHALQPRDDRWRICRTCRNDMQREKRRSAGMKPAVVKLTQPIVDVIRSRWRAGETQASIAMDYGVTQSTVSRAVHGRRRKGGASE